MVRIMWDCRHYTMLSFFNTFMLYFLLLYHLCYNFRSIFYDISDVTKFISFSFFYFSWKCETETLHVVKKIMNVHHAPQRCWGGGATSYKYLNLYFLPVYCIVSDNLTLVFSSTCRRSSYVVRTCLQFHFQRWPVALKIATTSWRQCFWPMFRINGWNNFCIL